MLNKMQNLLVLYTIYFIFLGEETQTWSNHHLSFAFLFFKGTYS